MANLIQIKRASDYSVSEDPSATSLAEGEFAWNNQGKKLWIGRKIATTGTTHELYRVNKSVLGTSSQINVTENANDFTISLPTTTSVTNLTVTGDLTVDGTTTTINSTTMTVDDKDLVLGSVASPSDSTANGGGIILKGANDKKLTYSSSGDKWVFNKALDVTGSLDVTGNIVVSGFVDGRDVASDGSKLDGIAANANNYSHPTHPGDDISVDTGALTGAVVISDLDFNVTTDTSGHVTDANGSVATRTLTLADLGYTGATNANNYSHPTHPGDDISIDTGALTGAVVISDLDLNVTTDTLGHVTDANATVATRTLTKANLGLGNVENTALSTATIDGGTF